MSDLSRATALIALCTPYYMCLASVSAMSQRNAITVWLKTERRGPTLVLYECMSLKGFPLQTLRQHALDLIGAPTS